MSEDWMLDESFKVESARDFINDLSPDEKEFLYHKSNMKVCPNCGEFISNISNGICNLCGKSDTHERIRGSSNTSEENKKFFLSIVNEFNTRNNNY